MYQAFSRPFSHTFRSLSTVKPTVIKGVSDDLLISTSFGHLIGGKTHKELVDSLKTTGVIKNSRVEDAFRSIDRQNFVALNMKPEEAYENKPLSIGYRATISTPQQHAQVMELMVEALQPGNKVLDVGCGSGILPALMAHLVTPAGTVHGVDIVPELVEQAKKNLETIRSSIPWLDNIRLGVSDGQSFISPGEKYDCIHVGIALPTEEMVWQVAEHLNPGGCLVVPLGHAQAEQSLLKINRGKEDKSSFEATRVMSVLCQGLLSEVPEEKPTRRTLGQVQDELEAWKVKFEAENFRKPTRGDIAASSMAAGLFKEFVELRTRKWD